MVGLTQELRRHAERGAGFRHAVIKRPDRGAVVGRDRQMQGVAGAQSKLMLVDKSRGGAEMRAVQPRLQNWQICMSMHCPVPILST